jgi:hypothetical protein
MRYSVFKAVQGESDIMGCLDQSSLWRRFESRSPTDILSSELTLEVCKSPTQKPTEHVCRHSLFPCEQPSVSFIRSPIRRDQPESTTHA